VGRAIALGGPDGIGGARKRHRGRHDECSSHCYLP
jgi:hypothetical protein